MQDLKVKEKVARIPGAHAVFGKINAVLQTTKSFVVDSGQKLFVVDSECPLSYEITKRQSVSLLEAQCLKAKAEQFVQNLRRRLI